MRYWVLVNTFVNRGTQQGDDRAAVQRSKISANDLAHAQAIKKELHSVPSFHGDYIGAPRPPVWMECDVCAELHTGRQGGALFVPVEHLSSLCSQVQDAYTEYMEDKRNQESANRKLKPSPSAVRATIAAAQDNNDEE